MGHNIERFKKRYLYKIRYQITLLLFFAIFLPIVFIQLLNYSKTTRLFLAKNKSLMEDNLQLSQSNINNVLGDYRHILFQMSTDVTCMDNILQLSKVTFDSPGYRRICDALDTYIRTNILMYPEIQAIGVISTTGTSYFYVQKREKTQGIIRFWEEEKDAMNQNLLSSTAPLIDSIPRSNACYDEGNPIFYLGSRTIHYEKMKIMGSIVLFISPDQLNEVLNNTRSQVYGYTDKLLVDLKGNIICSKEGDTGKALDEISVYGALQTDNLPDRTESMQGDYLVSLTELEHFELRLLNIVNYRLMNHDFETLWTTILFLMSAIMILAMITAYLLCRKLIVPIESMARKMNQVDENHLNITIERISHNEIGSIETSFNRMLGQIRSLLEENKFQYEQTCQAELKSLELQINPHFLFNTIDSINWTAVEANCLDVSEQLSWLADILRYTVYHMNSVVPLSEEITWIANYLDLQKKRFKDRFTYDIYDRTAGYSIRIHKLLLQPFLENALLHGFEHISCKGKLIIRFDILAHTHLLITIWDNGSGMPPEKVSRLNRLFAAGPCDMNGVGLVNITYRTRGYYPHSRIYAASSSYGTCFKCFIPLKEMEDSYDTTADC